ncbi:MAG: ParB/RepB/Spo0J family partition protein [Candidatus Promineifilaceae bacterium]|nr:ParB/RepB/Spo0J family partition protein [Candidatus Promineifilaceae bacterium]
MAKKKVGLGNLRFNKIDPYGRQVGDAEKEAPALTVHIDAVMPDPGQPRRLLPPDLAEKVHQGEISPSQALRAWMEASEAPDAAPSLVEAVEALRQLASSIERQGLINPITIRPLADAEAAPGEVEYLIVTGERRWWAHVLLALEDRPVREGDEALAPDRIKATVVAPGVAIRAHQLVENLMREDITLLEKARGMVALKEELTALKQDVAHGQQSGRPTATWSEVEEVLSISRPYRVRTLKVLSLCEEAQELVARHNLTERAIRPVTEKLGDYPDLQVVALEQLIEWQQESEAGEGEGRRITPSMARFVEQLLEQVEQPAPKPPAPRKRAPADRVQQLRKRVRSALRLVRKLDEDGVKEVGHSLRHNPDYADVVEDLRALRERIDAILGAEEGT